MGAFKKDCAGIVIRWKKGSMVDAKLKHNDMGMEGSHIVWYYKEFYFLSFLFIPSAFIILVLIF